ncbi:MAG: chitobiase/beta-hexosaminidase C-terminal domain-containing protein, partial [Bacteroidaceae bacterium]|nr:chitobiase/beta-hexosaminidase C-terminal domain-containing protein [Bacteroidaceae bacterium]
GGGDTHRKRVHLENTATPGEDQLFVFEPNVDGKTYNIRHKSLVVGSNKYLNPKSNNKDTYGDDNTYNYMVGLYSATTGGSKWFLVPASRFPSIQYNTDNRVEITYPEASNIYYTTDGSMPTTSSTPYTGAFELTDGMTTVKAIAESNPTGVVVFTPPVHVGSNHPRLIQSQSNKWNDTDPYFYLIPGDVDKTSAIKANTTSMFKPNMQWHFLSAGVEDGCQYYYVVNNNGQYLRYNSTNYIHLTDYDSNYDDAFKFRIPQNPLTGTPMDYNLVPHDITTTTDKTGYLVNKNSGNNNANAINLTGKPTDATSRWMFVTDDALKKTAPFTVSNSSSITSYKIQCYDNDDETPDYFIALPATATEGAKVRVSNSTDEDVVRTMPWYFELAQEAAGDDWTDYYSIRSSATGEYLYYIGNTTTSNSQVFELRSEYNEANKDRYLFTWVRTATPDNYFIVPKMVKEESQNDVSSLRRDGEQLKVQKNRSTGVAAWQFIETPFTADPIITQDIETGSISIPCHTPGVDIYYTTDGSDPVVPEVGQEPTGATKKYTASFLPESSDVEIKAVAVSASDHSAASTSGTTTKPLPKYTYHIVDKSGNVAISSNPVLQPTGKSLNGYSSIPEEIRSPYIADEEITFYNNSDCAEEHIISVTPATSDIYVKYTLTHLDGKFLHLQGARALNVTIGGDYISDNGGTFAHKAGATEDEKMTRPYLRYFSGNDPYALEIRNA